MVQATDLVPEKAEGDTMKLVVFGANGPTGQLLTKQALAEGHAVTAVTRHPEAFPLRDARLRVLRGDVFDLSLVEEAVAGQDAVLSTLGVPYSRKPITLYSQGTAHIVWAMNRYGVRRLVCVSSSGVDPHPGLGGFFFRKVLQPFFIGVVGRTLYADLKRMETLVRNSNLDWTIVRSSGLFKTPAVTDYQAAERSINGRFTSRADLADFMLKQLTDDQYLHKAVAVATRSGTPNFYMFLWKEGISKKPSSSKGVPPQGNRRCNAPARLIDQ
jgi:putative NADH-flavin reductase